MNRNEDSKNSIARLGTDSVGRLLWQYSLPAVVGVVVMSLYNVMDRIFIGRGVGADAIAGLAVTFPVMNLSAAIGLLVGTGAAARISILLGTGRRDEANRVLGNSVVLIMINAVVYLTLFAVYIDPILTLFGASPATLPYARDFMLFILPGMLIMNLMYGLNNIMRASGYPKLAMYTMLIGAGVNLVLGPLFIFGFGMGIKGAAIATDISMAVGLVFVWLHFCKPESVVRFRPGIYSLKWHIVVSLYVNWQSLLSSSARMLLNSTIVLELSESVIRKYTEIGSPPSLPSLLSTTLGTENVSLPLNSGCSPSAFLTVKPQVSGIRHSSTLLKTGATRSETVI